MADKKDLKNLKTKYSNFKLKPKKKKTTNTESKSSNSYRAFRKKLEEELFSEFRNIDWIYYFQLKYKECNKIGYPIVGSDGWAKERSIYKSAMKNFSPKDIKLMIDFIFDSDQDIVPKKQAGSYLLSKNWIQGIYRNAKLWEIGEYTPLSKFKKDRLTTVKKRNREWTKPVKDKPILPKRKKKGRITI